MVFLGFSRGDHFTMYLNTDHCVIHLKFNIVLYINYEWQLKKKKDSGLLCLLILQ